MKKEVLIPEPPESTSADALNILACDINDFLIDYLAFITFLMFMYPVLYMYAVKHYKRISLYQ